jgi:hypothetical protein
MIWWTLSYRRDEIARGAYLIRVINGREVEE